MTPHRSYERIFLALVQQNRDDRQLARRALVNQVRHHRTGLALDVLFAGAMKVKLQQLVALAIDHGFAAITNINLQGVAVVDNLQRA